MNENPPQSLTDLCSRGETGASLSRRIWGWVKTTFSRVFEESKGGIPRICHQIWIGQKPIPDRESAWCAETARMNPYWKHTLHGNELLSRYAADPYVKLMVAKQEKIAFLTDRLRVLLLRDEGGVYIDADAQPIKPLDSLPIWDAPHVDFVAGLRSPSRREVALHRAVPIVDNTFMGSVPNGRMIGRIESLWTPAAVTGENHAINGHRVGIAILEHCGPDTCLLNHRYIYCEQIYPESVLIHDVGNLASWCDPLLKKPQTATLCRV